MVRLRGKLRFRVVIFLKEIWVVLVLLAALRTRLFAKGTLEARSSWVHLFQVVWARRYKGMNTVLPDFTGRSRLLLIHVLTLHLRFEL
jgi:hypothetical protein